MTRRERGRKGRGGGSWGSGWVWLAAGLIVAGLALFARVGGASRTDHPEPRAEVTGERVVPAARYAGHPRIAGVYRMARRTPAVLDGIYCYCDCSRHAGHRSLLTCFESDHGARCDVCLSQAVMAYRLTREGESLDAVRKAIDGSFGS